MHHHTHGDASAAGSRAFAWGIALNLLFILAEVVFGLRSRSLALLSDAGHNFGDVLGLGLSWGALLLARRPPTARHTYGMRRASILASLGNAVLLLLVVGGIAWEALGRFRHPHPVAGNAVMLVAAFGIVINGASAMLFFAGRKRDLNVRSAFLHMVSDAAISFGVVLAGFAMARTGWLWLDPAVALLISAIVVWGTWHLLRESLNLAMDAVPEGIELSEVERYLATRPGVTAVHDLHVWAMSTTAVALTAHLVMPDARKEDAFFERLGRELRERFGIEHTTLQLEAGEGDCQQAPADVV